MDVINKMLEIFPKILYRVNLVPGVESCVLGVHLSQFQVSSIGLCDQLLCLSLLGI